MARIGTRIAQAQRVIRCVPPGSLLLRVEGGPDSPRQLLGRTPSPEVQEHDARLLVRHVVVDRDDVDVRVTQRLDTLTFAMPFFRSGLMPVIFAISSASGSAAAALLAKAKASINSQNAR